MIFELIAKDNKGKILASGEFDENEPFYISSDKTVDVGSFNYKKIMETMDYGVNIFEPVNDGEDFAFVYVSDDFMDYISIMLEINITKDDLIGKLFGESFPILKRIGLFLYQKSYKENKIIEFTISIFNKETRKLLAYNPQKLVRDEDKFFVLSKSDLDYKNVLKSRKNSFYNSSNALIYIAGNEIVNVNNVASKLINKSIDEIKGIKIDFNKFHFGMDSIEKTKEIYENLLNNQLYFHNWKVKKEFNINGDFKIQWLNFAAQPANYGDKKAILIEISDITNELKNEQLLYELNDHFDRIQSVSNTVFSTRDKYSIFVWGNEVYNILEREERESDSNHNVFRDYLVPKDIEYFDKTVSSLSIENPVVRFTFSIISEKGNIKHVFNELKANYDEEGNFISIVAFSQDVTELLIERDRKEKTFDNSLFGAMQLNENGFFIKANKRFKEISGFNDEELKKLRITDLILEFSNVNKIINNWDDVLNLLLNEIELISNSKIKLLTKNNGFKWIRTHSIKLSEKIIQTSCEDITEFIELENKSLRLKKSLDSIQSFSKITMGFYNCGNYYWTNEIYNLFDLNLNDDINSSFIQYLHFDDFKTLKNLLLNLNPKNSKFNLRLKVISRKNILKYLEVYIRANSFSEDGHVLEGVCFLQDISEKVEKENIMLTTQNNLKQIQKLSKFSIVSFKDGEFNWDDEIYNILEINKREYCESDDLVSNFVDKKTKDTFKKMLMSLSSEKSNISTDFIITTKNGNKKILRVNLNYILDSDGNSSIISFIQDVTDFEFLKEQENILFDENEQPMFILQDKKIVRRNKIFKKSIFINNSIFNMLNLKFKGLSNFEWENVYDKLINGNLGFHSGEIIFSKDKVNKKYYYAVAVPTVYNNQPAVQVSVSELTDKRIDELKILELQENINMIFDVAKEAIGYKKNNLKYLTDEVYNILEREPREKDKFEDIFLSLCSNEEEKRIRQLLIELSAENLFVIIRTKIYLENGKEKYVVAHFKKNFEINGSFDYIFLIRDVTTEVLSQKELNEKSKEAIDLKNNLEVVQGITKLAICNWNNESKIFTWTSEIYNILEINRDDFSNKDNIIEGFVINSDKKLFSERKLVTEDNPFWSNIIRVKTLKNNLKYLSIYSVNTFKNNIKSTVCFVQDITEVKNKELKALDLQKNLMEVQKISNSCMSYYVDDKLVYTPNVYKIIESFPELDSSDVIPSKYILPEDYKLVMSELANLTEDNPKLFVNYRIKTRSGKIKYISSEMKVEFDENGPINRIGVHRDITLEKEYENRLNSLLKEKDQLIKDKEFLLKEVHHRVKNNLQIILSLISLDKRFNSDPSLIISSVQNRINSIALIHEKIYGSNTLADVRLDEYIILLVESLLSLYASNINFIHELDEMELDMNLAVPIGLIINELINNTIKYAFPNEEEGNIFISLKSDENGIVELVVGDDGVGLGDVDIYSSPSLGLTVVNNLIAQIEGTIVQLDKPGTFLKIRFKQD